jgi:hypothetical protein
LDTISPQGNSNTLNNVDALEIKNYRFLSRVWLRLRLRKLEYLVGIPSADGAEIVLWCKRSYRPVAHAPANAVTLLLLERVFPDEETPAESNQIK